MFCGLCHNCPPKRFCFLSLESVYNGIWKYIAQILILGYKSAKEAAMVKHTEKMKQKQYEESLGDTYRETFEYKPRQGQNEKMFEEAKKRK